MKVSKIYYCQVHNGLWDDLYVFSFFISCLLKVTYKLEKEKQVQEVITYQLKKWKEGMWTLEFLITNNTHPFKVIDNWIIINNNIILDI